MKKLRDECTTKTSTFLDEKKQHVLKAVSFQNEIASLRNEVKELRHNNRLLEKIVVKKCKEIVTLRPWWKKKVPW